MCKGQLFGGVLIMDEVQSHDFDKIIPFTLRKSKVRGRFVKLDKSLNGILARHNYIRSISLCLSDALSASCCIGSFLKFDGLQNIPENFEVFLIDKSIKTSQNLKWKSDYLFDVASINSVRKLRLVVGEREFLNANNGGIDLFPNEFNISQNYPNPFNSQTSLNISLMDNAIIDIDIYNLLGEKVVSLAKKENRPAGYYTFIWDGKDEFGNILSSGVYLAAGRIADLKGNSLKIQNRKMVLVK